MKRIISIIVLIVLVTIQTADAEVHFAQFKFQPDQTYAIEIFHKNVMKFKFNDMDSPDAVPLDRVIPLENQVLFKAKLRTYPLTDANVIPVKMHLETFATLIKKGSELIPQDESANNEYQGKEFLGELDSAGKISPVEGRSTTDAVPGGDENIFLLLNMIPDMPTDGCEVGSDFFMNTGGEFVTPGEQGSGIAFTYTIAKITDNEVHVDIVDGFKQDAVASGDEDPLRFGTRGKLIYSLKDNICSYFFINTLSASEPEKEELKTKGVVLNNRTFTITIDVVE